MQMSNALVKTQVREVVIAITIIAIINMKSFVRAAWVPDGKRRN